MSWHDDSQREFTAWLVKNGLDPNDPKLSLGHLLLGQVDLTASFGTTGIEEIWRQVESHLDIYSIEVDGVKNTFEYCWTDSDYAQNQIDMMKPGYDHSSRG
jgi:hypothetical protein